MKSNMPQVSAGQYNLGQNCHLINYLLINVFCCHTLSCRNQCCLHVRPNVDAIAIHTGSFNTPNLLIFLTA